MNREFDAVICGFGLQRKAYPAQDGAVTADLLVIASRPPS